MRGRRGLAITSSACLILSGGMLGLSMFCLCTAGEMGTYFLIAAAVALLPFGYDPRPTRKLIGLGLIAANLMLAGNDHEALRTHDRATIRRLLTLTAAAAPSGK